MPNINPSNGSFLIKIKDQQNNTWQGTVTWIESKQTQPFRSLLELIKLIDSALVSEGQEEEEEKEDAVFEVVQQM